jgi:hypothetical protein
MTESNIFQEIQEDLERKQLEALWKRYAPLVIAAAICIVLATGGYTAWRTWRTGQEQKATAGLVSILESPESDAGKRIAALETFAGKNGGETQAIFARLHAAGLAAKDGKKEKAVALYDAVAGDTRLDPAFRQLADLYAVQAQMDTGDPVTLQKRLQPLLADNAPWRYTAMEDEAFLALRAGDKAKAKQVFAELSQDAGAPQGIGARATDMLRYLDE